MSRDVSKVLIKLEDEQQWEAAMELSETKLVVIDCHQEWCGCCEAIHPSMSRVLLDYDNVDERFQYATASIGKLSGQIQASFPPDLNISLEKNGCLPLFALYRHKTCITVVVGVDSPTLLQQISLNMPEKQVKE
eukprot:gene10363-11473_t